MAGFAWQFVSVRWEGYKTGNDMNKVRWTGFGFALTLFLAVSAGVTMPAMAGDGSASKRQPSNLLEVINGVPDEPDTAAEAPAKAGKSAKAVRAAKTRRFAKAAHPPVAGRADLKKRIAAHAAAAGVPADLAEAVVSHESKFNPKARGSAGEIGLMQIKPQTARLLGYRGSAAGLYDVETNLKWGMAYLAGAYRLADGDTCGTILRYNAGHGARRMTLHASGYCRAVQQYVAAL